MSYPAAAQALHVPRLIIENISPELSCGRYPVRRIVGDKFEVQADLVMDGHDNIDAQLQYLPPDEKNWRETAFTYFDNDRWRGEFLLEKPGCYRFRITARPEKGGDSACSSVLGVEVDPKLAEFSAWYEMFPRNQSRTPGHHGTFADCEARLPDIKAMGFDIVYLPPIHPIGHTGRKGKNNALAAMPGDPGSAYAIGSEAGGHKSIHPELGTLADFQRFVQAAAGYGIKVAMDFALQCSPDHPYIKEHPEWFSFLPDGSIKHAENPPKKYEDIVNFNFDCEAKESLWRELRSILAFWIEQGISIFRVDNPHTKPFAFWEWLIASIRQDHPDVLFLSEAFTRPKVMHLLARLGFTQSYTYFTWRSTKRELTEYLTVLTSEPAVEYFRPVFFPTTPDIFPYHLHGAGRAGFIVRLALAATLSSAYGMLEGYELCEGEPLPDGEGEFKEEYLDSEKYEIKARNWNAAGNIKPFITALNRIRRENPSLQKFKNLRFYPSSNEQVMFYGKQMASNVVFIAVNLDFHQLQESIIEMPLAELGIAETQSYRVDDLLKGKAWEWAGAKQRQRLDPEDSPVMIFRVSL